MRTRNRSSSSHRRCGHSSSRSSNRPKILRLFQRQKTSPTVRKMRNRSNSRVSSLVFHLALSGTGCFDAGELQARPRRRPCATSYGSSLFCITSTLTPWYPLFNEQSKHGVLHLRKHIWKPGWIDAECSDSLMHAARVRVSTKPRGRGL